MTQKRERVLDLVIVLMAGLTLLVAWIPTSAHAVVVGGVEDCTSPIALTDTDKDGFSNTEECTGITVQVTGASLPHCTGGPRNQCVDPNEQDVVIFLLFPTTGSKIPPNTLSSPYHPFDIVRSLGVTPHVFPNPTGGVSQTNRAVTGTQNGVVVFEDLTLSTPAMGKSKWGSVNSKTDVNSDTRVYTQYIICFVNQQYGLPCTNTTNATVYNSYILRTLNHEVSHVLALTNRYDSVLQNHYPETSAYLMNKSVTVTKKGTRITWSIPTGYTSTEPQQDCYTVSQLNASNNGVCQ